MINISLFIIVCFLINILSGNFFIIQKVFKKNLNNLRKIENF